MSRSRRFRPHRMHGAQRLMRPIATDVAWSVCLSVGSAVFTCIGALGTPSRTGPLARKYLPGFPYS